MKESSRKRTPPLPCPNLYQFPTESVPDKTIMPVVYNEIEGICLVLCLAIVLYFLVFQFLFFGGIHSVFNSTLLANQSLESRNPVCHIKKGAKKAQYVSDEFSHKSVSITVAGVPAGTMEVTHIN